MRVYSAQGQRQAGAVTYERCRAALEALGYGHLRRWRAQRATMQAAPRCAPTRAGPPPPRRLRKDERRLVSVLFAELSGPWASAAGWTLRTYARLWVRPWPG